MIDGMMMFYVLGLSNRFQVFELPLPIPLDALRRLDMGANLGMKITLVFFVTRFPNCLINVLRHPIQDTCFNFCCRCGKMVGHDRKNIDISFIQTDPIS